MCASLSIYIYIERERDLHTHVHIHTYARLKEFLNAEVTHFASMPRGSLTLQDLLLAAASPRNAAHQVHQEIPKHFAARIRQIEEAHCIYV